MLRFLVTLFLLQILVACSMQPNINELMTPFELSDSVASASYDQGIAWWKKLEESSPYVCVQTFGETDAGLPLHAVIINATRNFSRSSIEKRGKTIWLINNAIHPGEPDGVDASMLYARSLVTRPDFEEAFSNTVIVIIPYYNIGGALNRNCCTRANQSGPIEYGFRGNARNLDLNRDFAKADSRNARSFLKFYHEWDPDVYLETHVSNGADYPYTMTYLTSHPGKLTPPMDQTMREVFVDPMKQKMIERHDEMIPYVNVFGTIPDSGYTAFYDSPRYSTGYAALVNSFGLLTETHMLKPFKTRVASTLNFIISLGEVIDANRSKIQGARQAAVEFMLQQDTFVLDSETDMTKPSELNFKGYRAVYDSSSLTGGNQLHYNRSQTWEAIIPYYDKLTAHQKVLAPAYYLVPAGWKEVIDRLILNGVNMKLVSNDSTFKVTRYRISNFETQTTPYEGHYSHYNTVVKPETVELSLDENSYYLLPLDQVKKRLAIEFLEPEAPDSYFNWNFYDEILQQKEWFSSYVFEPEAKQMLTNPEHSKALSAFLAKHPELENDAFAKLYFLYKRSPHFEKDRYMVYPVYRIEK